MMRSTPTKARGNVRKAPKKPSPGAARSKRIEPKKEKVDTNGTKNRMKPRTITTAPP